MAAITKSLDDFKGDYITVQDYASVIGCGLNQAYADVKSPGFPSIRKGKRFLVVKSALRLWLDSKMKEPKTV